MDINYLKSSEVDTVKWNSCVHYAGNGNVFGYVWYLKHVAKDWDGLVEGDYESVFPLVWREDWFGGRTLYQPALMRSMGIYSIHVLSQARLRNFLQAIPSEYRQIDITINEQNRPPEDLDFDIDTHTNFQLLLNQPYEALAQNFDAGLREQLDRAEAEGLVTTTSLKPETIADFYLRHTRDEQRERNFHTLQRIMYNVLHRGWGFGVGAYHPDGELLAVNFYIYSHGKVMSLVPVTSEAGAACHALPFLYHMLVRSHGNRPMVLDFNTHEDHELAAAFGAQPNPFYRLQRNRKLLGIF